MKTRFIMVFVAAFICATTNAQSVGSIIAQSKKQHIDCDHVAIINGYIHDQPCGGIQLGIRGGYSHFEYSNEEGNFSTGGVEAGLDLAYRAIVTKQIALRPTIYGVRAQKMTFEEQDVESFEFGAELPLEIGLHHKGTSYINGQTCKADMPNKIWFSIGPKMAYHNVKSFKHLETQVVRLNIPAQSNVWMLGGFAELNFQIGAPATTKKVIAGDRMYKVFKHHPVRLSLGGQYMHGQFHKPADGLLKLNKWEGYVRLSYQL